MAAALVNEGRPVIVNMDGVERPAAPQRPPHQAYAEGSDEEDEPLYAALPEAENDFRMQAQPEGPRRRRASAIRSNNVRIRGGGLDRDLDEASSDDDGQHSGHLRGGSGVDPPTKTSAIGAGVLPQPEVVDTRQRRIK